MYICPTCQKEFDTEARITKHFLRCWKELHPNHVSKEAPRSADIVTKRVSNDVADFFNNLKEG